MTKVKIISKKRYPSNYQVRWEGVENPEIEHGSIMVSTDGLIDGDHHDEDTYGNDDCYIAEGFATYALDKAKEKLEYQGYEVVEVSNYNE